MIGEIFGSQTLDVYPRLILDVYPKGEISAFGVSIDIVERRAASEPPRTLTDGSAERAGSGWNSGIWWKWFEV